MIALALRAPGTSVPARVPALTALAGLGLEGDRHCDSRSPRQVLLASAAVYADLALPPHALRENLLLDLATADLASGMLLRIGPDAVLRLSFQCESCGALDLHRPGLARAVDGRRGMLARVLAGGVIREGDAVQVLGDSLPAMAEDWRERVLQVLGALPPEMVVDYAELARLAGIQSSYCRAFPRLLAARGLAGKAVPARSGSPAPRWDGSGLFDRDVGSVLHKKEEAMDSIRLSNESDTGALVAIWRASVRATHDFLSEHDFGEIETLVAEHYLPATRVWVALDAGGSPCGFMGLSGAHVDALFIDPARRGQGVGSRLLAHAAAIAGPLSVDVNEQNLQAVGFYRHLGFLPTGRSPTDDAGRPYPLLHMRQD